MWGDPPAATRSLALIFDDPGTDGGSWVHWVVYDFPPASRTLPEAVPAGEDLPGGGSHGSNSWGRWSTAVPARRSAAPIATFLCSTR